MPEDPRVLTGAEMRRRMDSAGEQKVLGLQLHLPDPGQQRVSSRRGDFELHRSLDLMLHDHDASRDLVSVADIPDLECDKVAATQIAVNAQVEAVSSPVKWTVQK